MGKPATFSGEDGCGANPAMWTSVSLSWSFLVIPWLDSILPRKLKVLSKGYKEQIAVSTCFLIRSPCCNVLVVINVTNLFS